METPNKIKILVTGGAGFIGSVLVDVLLREGYQVSVLDNLMYGDGHTLLNYFLNKNFQFHEGDIRNKSLVKELVKNADIVVHLAAIVGYPACRRNEQLAYEVNVLGTGNIVGSLSPNQLLVHASTGSNYGAVDGICTESTPLAPLSVYGRTKTEAEKIAASHESAVIYRFATGFGISPRLRLDLMINDFVYQALHAKNLVVYEKDFKRTFIHVQDIVRSIVFAIKNRELVRGQVFNVGSENMNLTKEDIVRKISERVPFYIYWGGGKDEDQRNYEVSYAKIKGLGFETSISLDKGIDELIAGLRLMKPKNPYSNI